MIQGSIRLMYYERVRTNIPPILGASSSESVNLCYGDETTSILVDGLHDGLYTSDTYVLQRPVIPLIELKSCSTRGCVPLGTFGLIKLIEEVISNCEDEVSALHASTPTLSNPVQLGYHLSHLEHEPFPSKSHGDAGGQC